MAAAILMMNMHGAVMTADKDQTIFRYSDKVPFVLIINPNNNATCKEVWETFQEMAALAKNLINFTELYHKLMCPDESVGGLIDLAVITREDGFQWLNRKSWYDPSRGGQYGKFGI